MSNQTARKFIETVLNDEALREKISSSTLDEALKTANELGYSLTEAEIKEAAVQLASEAQPLNPDQLDNVDGGTCFTAGSYDYNRALFCPTTHANAYRTGNEREDSIFFFWSRHQIEYHCSDCNYTWWVTQEHDDPAIPKL